MCDKITESGIQLYHGDCLEIMQNIPDKSIDMILCDLPYGITQNKWDNVIPFEKLWGGGITELLKIMELLSYIVANRLLLH